MVTTFRSSVVSASTGAPHRGQNRASSGRGAPHRLHSWATREAYGDPRTRTLPRELRGRLGLSLRVLDDLDRVAVRILERGEPSVALHGPLVPERHSPRGQIGLGLVQIVYGEHGRRPARSHRLAIGGRVDGEGTPAGVELRPVAVIPADQPQPQDVPVE